MVYTLDNFGNAIGNAATGVQNTVANLFAPKDTSALPYAAQLAAAARQQKMADLLMQQGQEQTPLTSYKGFTAQPSVAGGLGKALSQFMGAYMGQKADQNALDIANKGNENFSKSLANYYIDPGVAGSQLTPDSSMSLNLPSVSRPVFDKGANAFVPGATAVAPTDVALPGITTGSTPSHTRTLAERVAYDTANMQGGNPAQTAHFGTQYTTDAAKYQELQQLKPQVAAIMAQADVPDTIKSALTAGLSSEDPTAISAAMKEWLSKGTAQATQSSIQRDALLAGPVGSPGYNTYLNWKLNGVEPPEAFKQDLAKSAAQRSIITNSQGGANIPDNDPTVLGYVNTIHSGLGGLRSVPMNMRGAVARVLAAETDPSGSPTITALQTNAAKKITDPYTSNPHYTLYANAQPFLERLKAAAGMNSSIGDPDLLDSLTKLETGGNAITEAQISTNILGQSVKDRINVIKNKYTAQGGILSADQRKEVVQLGQTIYDNYKAGYKDVYTAATKQLNAAKIPSQYWTIPDLNQFESGANSGGNQSNIAPAGMSATLPDGTVVHSDGKGNWK